MGAFPIALVLGILGIVSDRRKGPAIISAVIAGAFVLLYLYTVGVGLFCR